MFRNADVDDLVAKADQDGDGQINYGEFVHMIMMEIKINK